MVQISRQVPGPAKKPVSRPAQVADDGDILSMAVAATEINDIYLQMVIYGQNRVGKTTLAVGRCDKNGKYIEGSGFPKPLLLVALEANRTGGALSIRNVPGVNVIRLRSTKQALTLARQLAKSPPCNLPGYENQPYATVVLDSATSYQDICLMEILDLPEMPEQLNWGMVSEDQYRQRSERTREGLRPFLNLPCHVVITAKERDHNANKGDRKPKILRGEELESFFASDLGGATVGWLHDNCDYIARLSIDKEIVEKTHTMKMIGGKTATRTEMVETGKIVRRLRTMYHPNYAAGFRSCNPEKVPEYIIEPTFNKIYEIIKGGSE